MKPFQISELWRPAQVKLFVQRSAVVLMIVAALGLMILGRIDGSLMERGRSVVADAAAPVLTVIARPLAALRAGLGAVRGWLDLRAENDMLRADNERLRAWQTAARRLAADNGNLRELLHVRPDPRLRYVTGLTIAQGGGPFVRTIVVDVGTEAGVAAGQVVTSGDGVVGRVLAAGRQSARVLLLSDLNSRVPVLVEGTELRAILEGDNSSLPRLDYLSGAVKVRPGDRIVTAGIGGLYPAGLPVGVVDQVTAGVARVHLWSRPEQLTYVQVVDYANPATADAIPSPGPPPDVPPGGYGAPFDPVAASATPPPPVVDPGAVSTAVRPAGPSD